MKPDNPHPDLRLYFVTSAPFTYFLFLCHWYLLTEVSVILYPLFRTLLNIIQKKKCWICQLLFQILKRILPMLVCMYTVLLCTHLMVGVLSKCLGDIETSSYICLPLTSLLYHICPLCFSFPLAFSVKFDITLLNAAKLFQNISVHRTTCIVITTLGKWLS